MSGLKDRIMGEVTDQQATTEAVLKLANSGRESGEARYVKIRANSEIEVVIAKLPMMFGTEYFISSPNFGVAIPSISSLDDSFWIKEKFIAAGVPDIDAAAIAKVLADIRDF